MFDVTLLNALLLIAAGFAAGFINVTAGGGSMFTVPALIFMGIPGTVANATNRIGVVFQSLSAIILFYRKGLSDLKLSFSLALCTLPGTIFGVMSASRLRDDSFNIVLAGVMVFVLFLTLLGNKNEKSDETAVNALTRAVQIPKKRLIWGHALMSLAGFWGGFIQIGVGFILIPILNRVMGFDLLRTNMHKVFILFVFTLVAIIIFMTQIRIEWVAGLIVGIGAIAGAWIGAHVQIKQGSNYIKWVINAVLIVFIIKLLFFT
ncbi:MAG: sulfite exporter TauE/SafE family protein [Hellea sp.]